MITVMDLKIIDTVLFALKQAHTGQMVVNKSNQCWCSHGFEFRCNNGEKLRITFSLDCCDCEALNLTASTGGFCGENV